MRWPWLLLDELARTRQVQIQYQSKHLVGRLRALGVRKRWHLLPDAYLGNAGNLRKPEHLHWQYAPGNSS